VAKKGNQPGTEKGELFTYLAGKSKKGTACDYFRLFFCRCNFFAQIRRNVPPARVPNSQNYRVRTATAHIYFRIGCSLSSNPLALHLRNSVSVSNLVSPQKSTRSLPSSPTTTTTASGTIVRVRSQKSRLEHSQDL